MMRSILFVGALATSIACATAGTTASGARHDANLITEEEVIASNGANAYEVISRARPGFLQQHGYTSTNTGQSTYPAVYLNGQSYGEISSLRSIPAGQIKEIRYYSATDAVTRFGSNNGTGIIQITTK